jgi:hypothetical protein
VNKSEFVDKLFNHYGRHIKRIKWYNQFRVLIRPQFGLNKTHIEN